MESRGRGCGGGAARCGAGRAGVRGASAAASRRRCARASRRRALVSGASACAACAGGGASVGASERRRGRRGGASARGRSSAGGGERARAAAHAGLAWRDMGRGAPVLATLRRQDAGARPHPLTSGSSTALTHRERLAQRARRPRRAPNPHSHAERSPAQQPAWNRSPSPHSHARCAQRGRELRQAEARALRDEELRAALALDPHDAGAGGEGLHGAVGRAGQARAEDDQAVRGTHDDPGGDRDDPDRGLDHEAGAETSGRERLAAGRRAVERPLRQPGTRVEQPDAAPCRREAAEQEQHSRDEEQAPARAVPGDQQAGEAHEREREAEDDGAGPFEGEVVAVAHAHPPTDGRSTRPSAA